MKSTLERELKDMKLREWKLTLTFSRVFSVGGERPAHGEGKIDMTTTTVKRGR